MSNMRVSGNCVVLSHFCNKEAEIIATNPVFYSLSNHKNRSFLGCSLPPLGGEGGTPGSDMKVRVGMGMGMGMGTAKNSGYGYTHFWVWPNTRVLGMGMGTAHKILGALKITRFSCSTMTTTMMRIVFT
jgi:hypothetical protein